MGQKHGQAIQNPFLTFVCVDGDDCQCFSLKLLGQDNDQHQSLLKGKCAIVALLDFQALYCDFDQQRQLLYKYD